MSADESSRIDALLRRGPRNRPKRPVPGLEYVISLCRFGSYVCTLDFFRTRDHEDGYGFSLYHRTNEGDWEDMGASGAWDWPLRLPELHPDEIGWLGSMERLFIDGDSVALAAGIAGSDVRRFVVESEVGPPIVQLILEASEALVIVGAIVPSSSRIVPKCRDGSNAKLLGQPLELKGSDGPAL